MWHKGLNQYALWLRCHLPPYINVPSLSPRLNSSGRYMRIMILAIDFFSLNTTTPSFSSHPLTPQPNIPRPLSLHYISCIHVPLWNLSIFGNIFLEIYYLYRIGRGRLMSWSCVTAREMTHVNWLFFLSERGTYLIGLRNSCPIFKKENQIDILF